jgi:hypothetical protein
MKTVTVVCLQGGQELARYSYKYPQNLLGQDVLPDRNQLINDTKTALTNDGKAFPPYAGIDFDVRW